MFFDQKYIKKVMSLHIIIINYYYYIIITNFYPNKSNSKTNNTLNILKIITL